VALLEIVLLERIHVVLHAIALPLFGGLRIRGDEVERLAVGCPVDVPRRRWVIGETARFAAFGAEEINLVAGIRIATRGKRDHLAVRRPARAALATIPERELHLVGAVDVDSIDVADISVGLPVSLVDGEQDLPAVRRQPRTADHRLLDRIDERPATLALRSSSGGGLFLRGDGGNDQHAHDEDDGVSNALHGLLLLLDVQFNS